MPIVVGGSLAGARWVVALSVVAWGVRVLRAKNILRQPPSQVGGWGLRTTHLNRTTHEHVVLQTAFSAKVNHPCGG